MSLRELYQEMIIDHGRHPRHFGVLAEANHQKHGHNPLCGDKLLVTLIEKDKVIIDVKFEGVGCAISVASASLMCEAIKGKTRDEVAHLFQDFHALVTTGAQPEADLGKLAVFAGVFEFPARVKCASLAWHTLSAALDDSTDAVSTE
jgi:nitrogen fixation NifU-like protein